MNLASRTLALALLAALFGPLAGAADDDAKGSRYLTDGDDCMFFRSIHNWKVLDDRNLIVWSPSRSQPYVVTLSFPITGLRSRETLAFEDHNNDGRLCGFGMDSIAVGGSFPQHASIRGIKKLDGTEVGPLEGLYERFARKKKDPDAGDAAAPADSKASEVTPAADG